MKEKLNSNIDLKNDNNLSSVKIFVSIFNVLLGLIFAYFIYFSHQMNSIQSELFSKIIEINAISVPYPFPEFIIIIGKEEFFNYDERKESLLKQFTTITDNMEKGNLSNDELIKYGDELQMILAHIAYSYPYKPMIETQKDGTTEFRVHRQESINSDGNIEVNLLTKQIQEIYKLNYSFTFRLKNAKERVVHAMFLAGGYKEEYIKQRIRLYLDSLISYLEKHYELVIPLTLLIKQGDIILIKLGKIKIYIFAILLSIIFLFGILLPLFWVKFRNNKLFYTFSIVSFILGMIILLREAMDFHIIINY